MREKLENFIEQLAYRLGGKEIPNKDLVVGDLVILPVCAYGPAMFWGAYLEDELPFEPDPNPDPEPSYFLARIVAEGYECGRNGRGKWIIHHMILEIEESSSYGQVPRYVKTNVLAAAVYHSAVRCYPTDNDKQRQKKLEEKHQRATETKREWLGEQPELLLVPNLVRG